MGRVTTYAYNSRGWVATSTDPLGRTTTYTYTGTGKLLSITDPATSGGATSTQYTYDDDDRLIDRRPTRWAHTTTTVYDGVGNVIGHDDANGHTTTYAYDSRNRHDHGHRPAGPHHGLRLQCGGNQITVTDALGHTTTTLYDCAEPGHDDHRRGRRHDAR